MSLNTSLFTVFSLFAISFTNIQRNVIGYVLCLDSLFCAFVGFGVSNTVGSGVHLGVGSGAQSLFRIFTENILLLE